ncbi:endo-1,4-beta-xylanase [bacterium BMS3Abin03]|nr:endo-1,4-beta-xylanase [bacterium BMS3Abin03]
MKKCLFVSIAFMLIIADTLKAQSVLSWDFESNSIGDTLYTIGWSPADIQSVVADDPVASGNNVLKNTVHNYNAAPVLMFVLPDGKTLADYDTLTFKGYFQKGDVSYKDIIAQAYQTKPIGHHFLDTDTLGLHSRAMGPSTDWENISLNISNASIFSDTVYIALGINCAGTSGTDTTTWYADDIQLVTKIITPPPPPPDTGNVVVNGGFEDSPVGIDTTGATKGWLFQVASVTPAPVFEIVSDTVEEGNNALKVTVHGLGKDQWDIQTVADSIHITPGVRYDYSIWAKADQPGAQVNFTVGNYSFSEYGTIRPANLTTKWNKYTLQITVNDGQTVIRAPIHFNYSGNVDNAVYIDNLRIAKHIEVVDSSLIWKGPALATGSPKFLGNAADSPDNNFINYWTQLTPENAGKWGSVGTTTDTTQWNWNGLTNSYNYAKNNGLIFKDHCLIWGAQQPSWISDLDSAQQINYIETWIRMVGQKYPDIDMIDVVNEPLNGHNPPDGGNGRANYKNALGGNGATGWDWVIKSFELARQYIPNAKLLINDYGIINDNVSTTNYLQIINLLKDRNLIDGIGVQGHRFELESADTNTIKGNLTRLAATGLPVYISEFDLGNLGDSGTPNDNQQLQLYKKVFPILWQHPGVAGITLWGYIEDQIWQTTCYLVRSNGTARPALWWLAQYIKDHPVGVSETASGLPSEYKLEQNFPNPFNPTTNIRYSIIKTTKVVLKIFDILGREVQTLVNSEQAPGQYIVKFDAQNLASGIYFYQINAGNFTATKKLMLLK